MWQLPQGDTYQTLPTREAVEAEFPGISWHFQPKQDGGLVFLVRNRYFEDTYRSFQLTIVHQQPARGTAIVSSCAGFRIQHIASQLRCKPIA